MDLSSAETFGVITYLINSRMRRCSIFNTAEYQRLILQLLRKNDFQSNIDCICVVGSMLNVVVGLTAISQVYPCVAVLLFDSTKNEYVKRHFIQGDLKDEIENTRLVAMRTDVRGD